MFEKETAAIAAFEQSAPKLKRSKELLKGLYYSDEMKHLIEAAKRRKRQTKESHFSKQKKVFLSRRCAAIKWKQLYL